MENSREKAANRVYLLLILATFFMYTSLTAAKNIYVAEKTTLEAIGIFGSFTELAATMEYYFYSYAVTQVLLIFFIKRINIKWYLTVTVGASAFLTLAMAFSQSITHHYVIYIINGVLQAGIWSCSMKVLARYLPGEILPFANKLMSSGPAVSGAVCYAVAALFGDNWRIPFVFLGSMLILAVIIFFISVSAAAHYPRRAVEPSDGSSQKGGEGEKDLISLENKKRVLAFYFVSAVIAFIVTALFFFLFNNLDLFLKQVGGFDNTTAKLITIIAPLVIVIGPYITVGACERTKNFILIGAVMFGGSAVFLLLLTLLFEVNIFLSLALFVGFSILANGGRMIPLSIVPLKMRDSIDSGVYSAVANSSASLASGLAPKFLAIIVDNEGRGVSANWSISLTIALAVCVLIVAILLVLGLFIGGKQKKRI